MALTEWSFNGLPPQWSLQSSGCIQWSWPIKMSKWTKLTLLTLFTTNLLITGQMALKYTPVCLFKAIFINAKSYMILGPEHGNIGLIQSS